MYDELMKKKQSRVQYVMKYVTLAAIVFVIEVLIIFIAVIAFDAAAANLL